MSYGNKGVSKQGINKADHGIVYMGSKASEPHEDELPARGELPMVAIGIRVDPDNPIEKLASKSRVHYSKVYTIEHNVKARSVGMIHPRSVPDLLMQTKLVWSRTPNGLGALLGGMMPGRTIDFESAESTSCTADKRDWAKPPDFTEVENATDHIERVNSTLARDGYTM
ncbi:uncharacterized protein MYCFIDRAFT_82867 [Pseudocercospora fijiensis CIRAD86]|uniref:DUF6590 domain-containing protein n=1 Tax=Pseudocercospora fijiensis (strain CIRAD86) TaxID=383855 RepID=M3B5Y9_PSEFD|nr:uncharacterized protein MYCFIDRAFT_82867 [Pseudocercospora fijiensis CIRAD86]EME84777.1 hypothetical protein MYCFIDRAFT_82867 [Pseudocercospora fijiensis CIRAD86]